MNSRKSFIDPPFTLNALRALLLLLLAPAPASALITPTINYQGYLISKETNLPDDTPQAMKFVIYDEALGNGGELFSETRCSVNVSKGRYDVEIGSGITGGIPASIFSEHDGLWLEVQVDGNGDCAGSFESMSPRIRLQASPYAFSAVYASTASAATPVFSADTIGTLPDTANGAITISSNLFVMGGVSVGSGLSGQTLAVAGIVESSAGGFKFPDGSIQSRAAAFTMWDGDGPNVYSINPGNVAIGQDNHNPLARLHISSAAGDTGDLLLVSTGTSQLFLVNGLGEAHALSFYGDGTTLSGLVRSGGDNMTGQLTLAGSTLTIASPGGLLSPRIQFADNVEISSAPDPQQGGIYISTDIYTTGRFIGDGSRLVNLVSSNTTVLKAGDTMTGQLTLANSTLTVTGNAFSVTGSTFSVFGGSVAIGGLTYPARLSVTGGINATADITAAGGLYAALINTSAGATFPNVTAASATLRGYDAATHYSLDTATGILVRAGVVTAPKFVGDGSSLTGVVGEDPNRLLRTGDTVTGNFLVSPSSLTIASYGPDHKYAFTVGNAAAMANYNLSVTTAGYVGVRVADPRAPLDVDQRLLVSNPAGISHLDLNSFADFSYINWQDASLAPVSQGALGFLPGSPRAFVYRAMGSDPGNGGSEVFRIASSDTGDWKFGIGTDSGNLPREKFHVFTNVLVSTSADNDILYVSTTTGYVSLSTGTQTHKLTVNGGIVARSSITAQGGFFAGMLDISTITARAGSAYDGVVFTTAVYIQTNLAVGDVFTPQTQVHVRGNLRLDAKSAAQDVKLEFYPDPGRDAYISWDEGALTQKGVLGMPAGKRELVYRASAGNLSNGVQGFRIKADGSFIMGPDDFTPGSKFYVTDDMTVGAAGKSPILFISTASTYVGISTGVPKEGLHVASSMLVGPNRASAALYVSTASGYTGIGTGAPQALLDVAGLGLFRSSAAIGGTGLTGAQSALEVIGSTLVVRNDGTVGIGTASPTERLEVAGKVKAEGFNAARELIASATCPAAITCTATCTAGKLLMSGGCYNPANGTLTNSYPSSDTEWTCDYVGVTNITAYAICSTVE